MGDITLHEDNTSNEFVAWSKVKRGPYMPTPIIYRGYLYTINNNGRMFCFDFETGENLYRESIPHKGGGFSASPVAADGKIYISGEDGEVFVVQAGSEYDLIATNDMGELLMASPAISDSMLYIRAEKHLFAIGKGKN
jgi:outer membrane protein assembly factor BamB